jgi:hypothetical protein
MIDVAASLPIIDYSGLKNGNLPFPLTRRTLLELIASWQEDMAKAMCKASLTSHNNCRVLQEDAARYVVL